MILDDSSYGSISFHLTSFQFHYIHFFAAAGLCIPMISLITWPRMDLGLGIANCSSSAGGCQDWVGLAHLDAFTNTEYQISCPQLNPPKDFQQDTPQGPKVTCGSLSGLWLKRCKTFAYSQHFSAKLPSVPSFCSVLVIFASWDSALHGSCEAGTWQLLCGLIGALGSTYQIRKKHVN